MIGAYLLGRVPQFQSQKAKRGALIAVSFLVLLTAQQLKRDESALSVEVNAMLWLWLWTPKFQRQTPPNAFFSTVVTVGCKSLTLYLSIYLSIYDSEAWNWLIFTLQNWRMERPIWGSTCWRQRNVCFSSLT